MITYSKNWFQRRGEHFDWYLDISNINYKLIKRGTLINKEVFLVNLQNGGHLEGGSNSPYDWY